jgi:hypothetical protein
MRQVLIIHGWSDRADSFQPLGYGSMMTSPFPTWPSGWKKCWPAWSALASKGKSFIRRVTKGLNNWFQTGTQMLDALELASPYQWGPALSDVLSADGTVRAAAANLTAHGATLDFSIDESKPVFTPWAPKDTLAPYAYRALVDEDHGSITQAKGAEIFSLIVQALQCPDEVAYRRIQQDWAAATDALEQPDDADRHRFFMLNSLVVDDLGQPVGDHFIECFGPDHDTNNAPMLYFHHQVIRDVHTHQTQAACRCFYLDRTALMGGRTPAISARPRWARMARSRFTCSTIGRPTRAG